MTTPIEKLRADPFPIFTDRLRVRREQCDEAEVNFEDSDILALAMDVLSEAGWKSPDEAATLTQPRAGGWKDDPATDERWNAGVDFAQMQLCAVLKVDPKSISWDAATETLDGDVQSVIGKILDAGLGNDDWRSPAPAAGADDVVAALKSIDREYETEYDGRMYTICSSCHKQDSQPHDPHCAWPKIDAALAAVADDVVGKLKQAIDECKDDTWECPQCGHSEPWWTESNAHYSSEYPTSPRAALKQEE